MITPCHTDAVLAETRRVAALALVERERDLYRAALGRIGRFSRCQEARDIADAALVLAKEMRERGAG